MSNKTALFTALAVTLLGALYIFHSPPTLPFKMSNSDAQSSDGVPGLEFRLSQISRNPPSLLVTLKNNNPTSPFSFLRWSTPLDPNALNLGVFKIIDEDTGKEVETLVIQIARMMPPTQEDIVTIAPGTEEATEVVFDKPWMPEKKPAKYKVKAEGEFKGVWDKYGGDLKESDLEAYIDSPMSGRKFKSNEATLIVH